MRPAQWIVERLEQQRGHMFPWLPVCMACGIATYFSAPVEPGWRAYAGGALTLGYVVVAMRRFDPRFTPVMMMVCVFWAGFLLAGLRAHTVQAPVLEFRYYGPVEGRIVHVDRSVSDKVRLTLDRVVLRDVAPARTPARVRVSLHGQQGYLDPAPGQRVVLTAHLGPPEGPVEPGGFDFQRMAWFDRLGAVGYTRSPALLAAHPEARAALAIARLRTRISQGVQAQLPGEGGAFAAAILTGDRSGMSRDAMAALRGSNLAHLLAISGLHMGLLTGIVFSAGTFLLAAMSLRVTLPAEPRKIAAGLALAAGAFYLALSGGNVATERAFIMASVMLVAVMLGRRALTLRAVALAAMIVLALRPEVLTEPGFQMSFAATTALVAVFAWLRDRQGPRLPKWARPVATLVISSAVAGIATAPVAAAHFNRIADYGLIANLVSVPLMGAVVMPGAVIAAVLWPLGLSVVGFWIMKPAIAWIMGVAYWVSGLQGAITHVHSPMIWALPLIALGGLWLALWRGGAARGLGVVPVVAGLALWVLSERPVALISPDGGLVGVMTEHGRALSKPKGSGFAAQSWLENDGDGVAQSVASGRDGFDGAKGDIRWQVGDLHLAHLSGRGARERIAAACAEVDIVVVTSVSKNQVPANCTVMDPTTLRQTGAVGIWLRDGRGQIVTARDVAGARLWNTKEARASRAGPFKLAALERGH
ncbi:ComEC/Rec2 family competence protein [Aliiroseovarius sp. PTFE2010]|uniref:ComEC/Rec2 family competence protein n=1 Tax=Aliiroseovarius sp. PTFE2010 TaxID=3417190 RepID=UPI003CF57B07